MCVSVCKRSAICCAEKYAKPAAMQFSRAFKYPAGGLCRVVDCQSARVKTYLSIYCMYYTLIAIILGILLSILKVIGVDNIAKLPVHNEKQLMRLFSLVKCMNYRLCTLSSSIFIGKFKKITVHFK